MRVRIQRLPMAEGLPLPAPASAGSAGVDLRAAVADEVVLPPGGRALIPTGLVLEIPAGWEGQVRPRSGLALRHGIAVLNSPGTIDSDYRGEVGVILANLGEAPFPVRRGDRIAQLVFGRVEAVEWEEVADVGETGDETLGGVAGGVELAGEVALGQAAFGAQGGQVLVPAWILEHLDVGHVGLQEVQARWRAGDRQAVLEGQGAGPGHVGVGAVVPVAADAVEGDQRFLGRGGQEHSLHVFLLPAAAAAPGRAARAGDVRGPRTPGWRSRPRNRTC